jgi:hypothetical protein
MANDAACNAGQLPNLASKPHADISVVRRANQVGIHDTSNNSSNRGDKFNNNTSVSSALHVAQKSHTAASSHPQRPEGSIALSLAGISAAGVEACLRCTLKRLASLEVAHLGLWQ